MRPCAISPFPEQERLRLAAILMKTRREGLPGQTPERAKPVAVLANRELQDQLSSVIAAHSAPLSPASSAFNGKMSALREWGGLGRSLRWVNGTVDKTFAYDLSSLLVGLTPVSNVDMLLYKGHRKSLLAASEGVARVSSHSPSQQQHQCARKSTMGHLCLIRLFAGQTCDRKKNNPYHSRNGCFARHTSLSAMCVTTATTRGCSKIRQMPAASEPAAATSFCGNCGVGVLHLWLVRQPVEAHMRRLLFHCCASGESFALRSLWTVSTARIA
jgi:hypothetical protein